MSITPAYAAILALFFVGLSVRTLLLRRRLGVALGDGGNPQLLRASRIHANFAEYVPLCIILLGFCEANGANPLVLHAAFTSLVVARAAQAYGVSHVRERFGFRVFGVAVTLSLLIMSSFYVLAVVFRARVA